MQDLLSKLMARRGQYVTLSTRRPVKMRKGQPEVFKLSTYTVRVGVNYDNIGAVKEKREAGELPEKNAGLPWGEWMEFPYTIGYKGETYLRCTLAHGTSHKATVAFELEDGTSIEREQVQIMALASEFKSSEDRDNDVFNIKLSSITQLHEKV